MNNIYEITKAKELVTFLHAAAGFPVVDTWVKAIRNEQFATWPGFTSALVYKNLPKSNKTVKGHLKQQQQNVRSTQQSVEMKETCHSIDEQTNNIFAAIVDYCLGIFTNTTGPSPVVSSMGN